jgi:adenylate cyclase
MSGTVELMDEAVEPFDQEQVGANLLKRLTQLGIDERALAAAATEGPDGLRRLIARHGSFPGVRRYTSPQVCAKAGVEDETAKALWRAMGFPVVPDDEVAFSDDDIEALRAAKKLLERPGMDEAIHLQQARTMGQAAARVAASHQEVLAARMPEQETPEALEDVLTFAEQALPILDRLLVYMYRRHLAAATEQTVIRTPGQESVEMSVGFADLSGFTALSQDLDSHQLGQLIELFNGTAADLIAEAGGRVVKTIGDEVMFTAHDPGTEAALALTLVDRISELDELPRLKAGLAHGSVIAREGDVFGMPVNLAKRLVASAKPGSVLVDEATKVELEEDDRFRFTPLARRHLKGFGHVRTFRLRAAGAERARR